VADKNENARLGLHCQCHCGIKLGMTRKKELSPDAIAFYDLRRVWIDYVCECSAISDSAFRIGHWIAKRMNHDDKCCWYSIAQIAKALDVSPRKVMRAVAELENERVLLVVRKHRKSNSYHIRLPFDLPSRDG
jgi:hypothetical protein